jgi:hypothetical protein
MSFINDLSASFDRTIIRRADGTVDREHYETLARRERAAAAAAFWRGIVARIRGGRPATSSRGISASFREA